jgi:serine/threonine protein kinase
VKLIDLECTSIDIDQLRQSTAFWFNCHHPAVISYYGSFVADSILWCLMEYMDGGSVADVIQFSHPQGFRDESVIATIVHQLLLFLSQTNEHNTPRRPICLNRILLTTHGDVKLGDMGISNGLRECQQKRGDIWNVGIATIAMATGRVSAAELSESELSASKFSAQLRDFVHQCTVGDPAKRPSAALLLKHPFIKRANSRDFLAAAIMADLPPLSQRFERTGLPSKITHFSSTPIPRALVAFDFDGENSGMIRDMLTADNPEKKPAVQVGRFWVTVQRRGTAPEVEHLEMWNNPCV